ncbi:hypothetical protein FACS1894113_3010 [Alphaproteobacteria bacterium]|nr:hypothetical protein FACS1894113_3010 [Alphaproteobacteria bacterium]
MKKILLSAIACLGFAQKITACNLISDDKEFWQLDSLKELFVPTGVIADFTLNNKYLRDEKSLHPFNPFTSSLFEAKVSALWISFVHPYKSSRDIRSTSLFNFEHNFQLDHGKCENAALVGNVLHAFASLFEGTCKWWRLPGLIRKVHKRPYIILSDKLVYSPLFTLLFRIDYSEKNSAKCQEFVTGLFVNFLNVINSMYSANPCIQNTKSQVIALRDELSGNPMKKKPGLVEIFLDDGLPLNDDEKSSLEKLIATLTSWTSVLPAHLNW